MPRRSNSKKKSHYNNYSTVCNHAQVIQLGYDESVWDDTELIDQFEEALRDWKAERSGVETPDGHDTDPEQVPDIGPWVEVPAQKFDPEAASYAEHLPSVNDMEMIELFDEALSEWKTEREPVNWEKYLEELVREQKEAELAREEEFYDEDDEYYNECCEDVEGNSAEPGPWVMVDPDDTRKLGNVKELLPDEAVVDMYEEALREWKEERLHNASNQATTLCSDPQDPIASQKTQEEAEGVTVGSGIPPDPSSNEKIRENQAKASKVSETILTPDQSDRSTDDVKSSTESFETLVSHENSPPTDSEMSNPAETKPQSSVPAPTICAEE